MNIKNRVNQAVQGFMKNMNSVGDSINPNHFLKYGNNKPLVQDWSKVIMSEKDKYTGYPYAAIDRRGNRVASLAKYNLKTNATKEVQEAAKKKDEPVVHPYIQIIDESKAFANRKFWYDISTYLDLHGVYYLFAMRTVEGDRVGNIQYFKLLNPYNIRRIINKDTLEIGGYVETRNGLVREFPPKMIIEMRKLNPFDDDDPFSMSDAAKTAQFTLKQGGDYTRHSLKNNMSAPGIISTDVLLDPEMFANFVSRVTNQEKGLPLFGNGGGAITWNDMQIDMDKAALKDINEINRQELFAVSGAGKTMLAIEESGTTRDTAEIQGDLFVEYHALPQIELILDSLNQDFKVHYETEYKKTKYELIVDNPLGTDLDAESKDIAIRSDLYDLYTSLVNKGYDRDLASRYAKGEIDLEELGEPTNEPIMPPVTQTTTPPAEPTPPDPAQQHVHEHDEYIPAQRNAFDEESAGLVQQQQGALQNAIENLEGRVTSTVLNKVTKNKFDDQSEIINKTDKNEYIKELALIIGAFYGIIVPLSGRNTMSRRAAEFGELGIFKMDAEVRKYIKDNASKAAESHINTILDDLQLATKKAYDNNVKTALEAIEASGEASGQEAIRLAQKKALEGSGQQEIVSAIKKEYKSISTNRAKAIARTETNRAFTQSQYQADLQFVKQNDLEGRAYKKWITRSAVPCQYCLDLAAQPPIPLSQNFADLGDTLEFVSYKKDGTAKVNQLPINYEALNAGNAHVNCACRYQLIIE